jgi:amino acid adenylation domain-containing protein
MPAYVFFTSGTTGTPKGVLGWHKGLSQFLVWQRDTFAIGPADRAAQMTGISFDVVLRDIFLPLVSGATLCLPGELEDVGPERVMDWLREDEITVLHAVPTRAQSWLDGAITQERPAKLRYTFFAGEPLSDVLVQRWRAAFPGGEIVNLYGPTETTLAKFFYREPASPPPGMQPVGIALPDTQALVLREGRQLCGINDIGEVFLRTPYRSLGYLNAPDENQSRFVPNPFRADDDDILYRTGDGGRYRPDGNLELVGRLDHQIKIQGVRVEPDEIMAILMQHPAMKSCVVMPWKDEQDQSILVAFVVVSKEQRVSTHELRSHVSRQLPAAMVPSNYVFLERLPLTPNGKVDRLALPLPVQPRRESGPGFAAPQTTTEEKLAKIWGDVIGVEEIGIHDNFFDLGGHSMLATRVIAQVKEVFQVQLPLCRLFETPTVARMAENIDAARRLDDGL